MPDPAPLLDATLVGDRFRLDGAWVSSGSPEAAALRQPGDEAKVYELIRVIDGVPLFWEDHLDRLDGSARAVFGAAPDRDRLRREFRDLVRGLSLGSGNVRIVTDGRRLLLHANRHFYPPEDFYARGVPVGLLDWERPDPQVKAVRADYRAAVTRKLAETGPHGPYFETLLRAGDGCLAEGSRTSAFFLPAGAEGTDAAAGRQDGRPVVLTAPLSRVLAGVTRRHVLRAVALTGGVVLEAPTTDRDLAQGRIRGVFLTGTSIGTLPVSAVEAMPFPTAADPFFQAIRRAYQRLVDDMIRNTREDFE